MKYRAPQIEETNRGEYYVTVHDVDADGYRRAAGPEETHQAILYWIQDIHARIGKPD